MKVDRKAPKKGYDNEIKMEYRHKVWKYLSKKCLPTLRENDNCKVLLLPSKEGIEIDVALSYGIRESDIIAIDENPAVIAVSKWRKKYPNIAYFGCKVSKVGSRIREKGWYLAGANLDFCNTFSEELINEINCFFKHTNITNNFSFCVTMGKGRESKALYLLLQHLKTPEIFKHNRLAALYVMLIMDKYNYIYDTTYKDFLALDFEDSYFSTFPMIYAGFSLHEPKIQVFSKEQIRHNILWERHRKVKYLTISRGLDYNKLQNKRGNLVARIEKEARLMYSEVESMVDMYCINNNIIQPKKYTSVFMDKFIYANK